jgi:protein-L-isoaspartate(D-aspartate) O-methyltransferase
MVSQAGAVESGLVDPMFPGGALAVVDQGDLVYLTWRAAEGAASRRERAEVGVIGHGPGAGTLTERIADAVREWECTYRGRGVRFEIREPREGRSDPGVGRFLLDRPHRPLAVMWQ